MSERQAYLDRMGERLAATGRHVAELKAADAGGTGVRDLEAALAAAQERLQAMRRAGADLDEDGIRSFNESFDRLNAAVGRARQPGGPAAA